MTITQEQVQEAYKRVKANQGAAGIDGVTFVEYEKDLKNNLYKLWNRMSSGSYFPTAVKGVEIPKKNGKMRLLGIPTITDRVAQMVLRMNFEPLVEPIFCEDSYGYRPNQAALDAVGVTRKRCWKLPWVLEFDIKGLFDNIDHRLMMQVVRKHTNSKWVIIYIERSLKADMVMPDGSVSKRTSGTPQGGVISPVLANLYMLKSYRAWQNEEKLKLGKYWQDSNRLFTTFDGEPIHPDTITWWFAKFIKRNNLDPASIHSLRHTNITLLIMSGVPLQTVAKRAGHSSSVTTSMIYSHAIQSADEMASEVLGDILRPKRVGVERG